MDVPCSTHASYTRIPDWLVMGASSTAAADGGEMPILSTNPPSTVAVDGPGPWEKPLASAARRHGHSIAVVDDRGSFVAAAYWAARTRWACW
jgi:hypothetical protein